MQDIYGAVEKYYKSHIHYIANNRAIPTTKCKELIGGNKIYCNVPMCVVLAGLVRAKRGYLIIG